MDSTSSKIYLDCMLFIPLISIHYTQPVLSYLILWSMSFLYCVQIMRPPRWQPKWLIVLQKHLQMHGPTQVLPLTLGVVQKSSLINPGRRLPLCWMLRLLKLYFFLGELKYSIMFRSNLYTQVYLFTIYNSRPTTWCFKLLWNISNHVLENQCKWVHANPIL